MVAGFPSYVLVLGELVAGFPVTRDKGDGSRVTFLLGIGRRVAGFPSY